VLVTHVNFLFGNPAEIRGGAATRRREISAKSSLHLFAVRARVRGDGGGSLN